MSEAVNHLERFYPTDEPSLGITKSAIGAAATRRHYDRYKTVAWLLHRNEHRGRLLDRVIYDIGCGSGYGTAILASEFDDQPVVGIEPDPLAASYARLHFGEAAQFSREMRKSEHLNVSVFVESVEHMTPESFVSYASQAEVIAVTTPIVKTPTNPLHINAFTDHSLFLFFIEEAGFRILDSLTTYSVAFTTGEVGDQAYIVAVRR